MKKILILALLLTSIPIWAQQSRSVPRFSAALAPIDFLAGRTRMDFELGLGEERHISLSLSPILYNYTTSFYFNTRTSISGSTPGTLDTVKGAGLSLQARFYDHRSGEKTRMYGTLGLAYHALTLRFVDANYEAFSENNLTYYKLRVGPQWEKIKRTDLFVAGGAKHYFSQSWFFDFQLGIKYSLPNISSSMYVPRKHDYSIYDQGYKGLGFRGFFTVGYSIW